MTKEKLKCKRCRHKVSISKYRSLEYQYCRSCERALNGGNLPKIQGKVNPLFLNREENRLKSIKLEYPTLPGIYSITCTVNNKTYIGQSKNLKSRLEGYKKKNRYINPILKKDLETYGIDKFIFKILEVLPKSSEDERLDLEATYKSKYSIEELYNLLPGRESKEDYQKYKESKVSDYQHQSIQS